MVVETAEVTASSAAERLWTARVVHTALEEGLAKIDMAVATYGRREPLSLFCYGEPGTGKTTLAELFIERYRSAQLPAPPPRMTSVDQPPSQQPRRTEDRQQRAGEQGVAADDREPGNGQNRERSQRKQRGGNADR